LDRGAREDYFQDPSHHASCMSMPFGWREPD
jgi:hypothetical protein